jgi:acyl-CoA dehydrogenase
MAPGPSNYIQGAYQMVPVGITVEGANILTRTLITFAQGALRSHPYLFTEIEALQNRDQDKGVPDFERAFDGHVAFTLSTSRFAVHNRLALSPAPNSGATALVKQSPRLTFLCARRHAIISCSAAAQMTKITGRMAALAELYLLSCILKRYEDDGCPALTETGGPMRIASTGDKALAGIDNSRL